MSNVKFRFLSPLGCLFLLLGCETTIRSIDSSNRNDTETFAKEQALPKVTCLLGKNISSPEVQLFFEIFQLEHKMTVTTQYDTKYTSRKLTRIENHFSAKDALVKMVSCIPFSKKDEVVSSLYFLLPVSEKRLADSGFRLPYNLSSDATPKRAIHGWGHPDLDRVNREGDGFLYFSFRGEDLINTNLEYRDNKLIGIEFAKTMH